MSARLKMRRAPSLDTLTSTNLALSTSRSIRRQKETIDYSSDEYSGRDSSEDRSKRRSRRDKREKSRKSGRERSVSTSRPRVGIGGTGIEENGRDRPSSARHTEPKKEHFGKERPQTARPSDHRRDSSVSSISSINHVPAANQRASNQNRLSNGSQNDENQQPERSGRSSSRNIRPYLQRSQSEVSLTPRQKLADNGMAADRFRQSLQMAANRLQSSVVRRVNPPSQPTTPTTPSAPFGGGHPLAMAFGGGTPTQPSSTQATPVVSRRDVPPSPDNSIRGSKTFMRLNKELDNREKQTGVQVIQGVQRPSRPTSLYSDNEATQSDRHSDARPPKNSKSTPDRSRKLVLTGNQLPGVHSAHSEQRQEKSISQSNSSKIGDLVRAGVGRDGLDSPGHDKSSGVSSYNSEAGGVKGPTIDTAQMNQLLTRLTKIEEENYRLRAENEKFKSTLDDTNVTLKDEFGRFEKEIKGLKQTIIRQNEQIIGLAARVGAQEANRALSSMELEPPNEKDIETINDVGELEKMLEYENDYENRKRIRAQLRLLNKKKNEEREQAARTAEEQKRSSIPSPKGVGSPTQRDTHALTINSTDDDEIKVEKRSRQRSRLQRSQTIATSTSTQNVLSTTDGKLKPLQSRFNSSLTNINRNEELREHRSESLISLNESEFASASPSPDTKGPTTVSQTQSVPQTPTQSVPLTPTSVPQTPTTTTVSNPLSSSSAKSISTRSLNQTQRPQTARPSSPESKADKTERPNTARAKAEDDSSIYSKSKTKASYTQSGRSYTMSALDQKTTDKKESAINDLKKRAELRKNDHFIKRVNSMPNGGSAAVQTAKEKFLAKIGEDPTKKVKLTRSNTFSSGGATGVKALLLKWCQARLRTYSVDVTNYSSSWADGSAFCGLVHSFFPNEFSWSDVHENADTEEKRRHNFNLAFDTALKCADAEPLIEVDDMIFMGNRPDAKCIFCYLQSLYNKLKKFEKLQKAEAEV